MDTLIHVIVWSVGYIVLFCFVIAFFVALFWVLDFMLNQTEPKGGI